MVEGELDVEDNNPNKPGGVLKRKFKNLYVHYVTTGSPWFAIDKYRQRFVFKNFAAGQNQREKFAFIW